MLAKIVIHLYELLDSLLLNSSRLPTLAKKTFWKNTKGIMKMLQKGR